MLDDAVDRGINLVFIQCRRALLQRKLRGFQIGLHGSLCILQRTAEQKVIVVERLFIVCLRVLVCVTQIARLAVLAVLQIVDSGAVHAVITFCLSPGFVQFFFFLLVVACIIFIRFFRGLHFLFGFIAALFSHNQTVVIAVVVIFQLQAGIVQVLLRSVHLRFCR